VDLEDVRQFTLADDRREELLRAQRECTFTWASRDGQPVGVTMSYLWHDGFIWLACTKRRKRTRAVQRDPRVSIVVSSAGTSLGPSKSLTYLGRCEVLEDPDSKRWFFTTLADTVFGDNEAPKAGFISSMDTPNRVVLKVTPGRLVNSYDGDGVRRAMAADPSPG
jgi:nitroimidazol reductase NimA-like FMN-containing flavoprotein (pyridoxamine 5'-phosphate oxidase superfamily)